MDESLYDRTMVAPMAAELNHAQVRSLSSAEEVDETLTRKQGSTLVVVNSVCGCAAGNARPGVTRALQHGTIPDDMVTVFAGVDRSATERARQYMTNVAPSSPCIALFKDGEMVHVLERRHIETMSEETIAQNLAEASDKP